jgi:hypothetical protein
MASITVEYGDPNTGALVLSDRGITNASRGEVVIWNIAPNANVASIVAIHEKQNSTDVFNPDPHQLGNSTNWQGNINNNLTTPVTETYYIAWTDTNGATHVYDPIIQVNN